MTKEYNCPSLICWFLFLHTSFFENLSSHHFVVLLFRVVTVAAWVYSARNAWTVSMLVEADGAALHVPHQQWLQKSDLCRLGSTLQPIKRQRREKEKWLAQWEKNWLLQIQCLFRSSFEHLLYSKRQKILQTDVSQKTGLEFLLWRKLKISL